MSDPSTRWAAVVRRDPSHANTFVYCVKTTRIFCRPTCKARLARRTNVFFCDNASQALELGYRACKRCKPEEGQGWVSPEREKVGKAVGILRGLGEEDGLPGLESLAAEVGLTKWHFWRLFRREVGCTPREFVARVRAEREGGGGSEVSGMSTVEELSPVTPGTNLSETVPPLQIEDDEDEAGIDWSHLLTGPDPYGYDLIGYTLEDNLAKDFPIDQVEALLIYYNIVQTTYGNLLVAFKGDEVCKLELGGNEAELIASLETSFPSLYYIHSHISLAEQAVSTAYQQRINAVVNALEFPTGKMLDVPMSLGADGHLAAA